MSQFVKSTTRAATLPVAVLLALLTVVAVVAEEAQEIPLPKLPKSAGKVDPDAPKTFTKTRSGLKYRILRQGQGRKPSQASSVEVNYHGWLDDGKVFDSSYERGESISFPLNRVIKGWTEGMQLVAEGGMIELEIPAELGYGQRAIPDRKSGGTLIPASSTLHFLVELIEVQ